MNIIRISCGHCGRVFEDVAIPRRGKVCFRCHVKTVNLGFTYGKADFHGDTVSERARKQVEEAAKAGIKAEPVGTRWV